MNLKQLQQAVQYLSPSAIYQVSYTVSVDGDGNGTLDVWNSVLGAQPSADQLTTALAAAQLLGAQTMQTAAITAAYQAARYGASVSLTVGSTTLSFPTDPTTQTNIMGYLVAFTAETAPATMPLLDASGNTQSLTYTQLQTLAQSIASQSITIWQSYTSLCAQIEAATTISALQAITW
jgi:hypothetical protein